MSNRTYTNYVNSHNNTGTSTSLIRDEERYHVDGYRHEGDDRGILVIGAAGSDLRIHGTGPQLEALVRHLAEAVTCLFPPLEGVGE